MILKMKRDLLDLLEDLCNDFKSIITICEVSFELFQKSFFICLNRISYNLYISVKL